MVATSPASSRDILQELEKTRIQRELAIAYLIERRKLAYKLAEEREKLNWTASGGLITSVLSVLSSYHHKNLIHLLPIIPIAAYIGYSSHYCYGNKVESLNKIASNYAESTRNVLLPISVEDVRKRMEEVRIQADEEEKFSF